MYQFFVNNVPFPITHYLAVDIIVHIFLPYYDNNKYLFFFLRFLTSEAKFTLRGMAEVVSWSARRCDREIFSFRVEDLFRIFKRQKNTRKYSSL